MLLPSHCHCRSRGVQCQVLTSATVIRCAQVDVCTQISWCGFKIKTQKKQDLCSWLKSKIPSSIFIAVEVPCSSSSFSFSACALFCESCCPILCLQNIRAWRGGISEFANRTVDFILIQAPTFHSITFPFKWDWLKIHDFPTGRWLHKNPGCIRPVQQRQ